MADYEENIEASVAEVQFEFDDVMSRMPRKKADTDMRRRSSTRISLQGATKDDDTEILGRYVPELPNITEDGDVEETREFITCQLETPSSDPTKTLNYADYRKKVEPNLATFRYQHTPHDLLDDIRAKVNYAASTCLTRQGEPGFPYNALTTAAKRNTKSLVSTFRGILTKEVFRKMLQEDATAVYLEMKIRTVLLKAYKDQSEEMHNICRNLDTVVGALSDWTHYLGKLSTQGSGRSKEDHQIIQDLLDKQNESAKALAAYEEAVKQLHQDLDEAKKQGQIQEFLDEAKKQSEDDHQVIRALQEVVADKDRELEEANTSILDMIKANRKLETELRRTQAKLHDAEARPPRSHVVIDTRTGLEKRNPVVPIPVRERQDTPATQTGTEYTSGGTRKEKSEKTPDVPVFTGEDTNPETFEVWYRGVTNKFEVNADRFHSDRAKMAYVEGRLSGKASRNLLPYLRETHPEQITTSEALLDHLYNEYYNPNSAEKAIEAFNDLKMKPGDDYHDFRNEFVRLAGECGRPKRDWKAEFKRRLLPTLQDKLVMSYLDPTVEFEQYARTGAQLALTYEMTRKHREKDTRKDAKPGGQNAVTVPARRNNFTTNRNQGSKNERTTGNNADSRPAKARDQLSKDDYAKFIREGRCFNCKELGHMAGNCPKKEARIQEIAERVMHGRTKKDVIDVPDDGDSSTASDDDEEPKK